MDTRRDAGEFYPGGKVISTRPLASGGDVKRSEFEDLDVKTNTIPDLREAVRELGRRLGATVVTALVACVAIAATVQTVPVNDIDFNANPSVVTNVVFDAPPDFSTSNAALVATIEATAPAPGNYAAVSNAAMNALSRVEAEAGFTEWVVIPSEYEGKSLHIEWVHYEFDGMIFQGWEIVDSDGEARAARKDYPTATNLFWSASDTSIGAASATRTRLPTMADIPTAQINAATTTNALQDAAISTLSDTKVDRSELAGYATPADLPYTLGSTITASATLADRTNNLVAPTNGNAAIVLTFPAAVSGKSRDFTALLSPGTNFSGSISFTVPSGATIYGDGFGATVAPGESWLFSVTEIAAGTFYVSAIKMEAQ